MEIIKSTEKDLEKINQFTRRELTADEVYVFTVALCNNDIDRDYEKFTIDALKAMQPMFIGKTGILDHSMSAENQNSRIFETWLEKVDGKKTRDGEDFYELKAKAYIFKSDKTKTLIDEIDAGIKKEVSVSCSMSKSVCSICGNDQKQGCEHIRGNEYDGELCYFTLENPEDVYEFSFVAVPAQRNAGVTKCFDLEKGRECRKVEMLFENVGVIKSRNYEKERVRIEERFDENSLDGTKINDVVLKDGEVIARSKDGDMQFTQDGTSIYFTSSEAIKKEAYIAYTAKSKLEFQRMDGDVAVYRRNIKTIEKIYSISIGEGIAQKSIDSLFDGAIKEAQAERLETLKRKKLEAKKQIAKSILGG